MKTPGHVVLFGSDGSDVNDLAAWAKDHHHEHCHGHQSRTDTGAGDEDWAGIPDLVFDPLLHRILSGFGVADGFHSSLHRSIRSLVVSFHFVPPC